MEIVMRTKLYERLLKENDSKFDFIHKDENMELLFNQMEYKKGEELEFCQTVRDIINHGIDGGFNGFIYTAELEKFYDANKERIMDELIDALGAETIFEVIKQHVDVRSILECDDQAKSWYVWAFAEQVFFSYEEEIEEALK